MSYVNLPGFESYYDAFEGETLHHVVSMLPSGSYAHWFADGLMLRLLAQYLDNRKEASDGGTEFIREVKKRIDEAEKLIEPTLLSFALEGELARCPCGYLKCLAPLCPNKAS